MVTESMDNMGTYEGKILFNLFEWNWDLEINNL